MLAESTHCLAEDLRNAIKQFVVPWRIKDILSTGLGDKVCLDKELKTRQSAINIEVRGVE